VNDRMNRPLWRCPACRRVFANARQSHACGRYPLASHFKGKPRQIRLLFNAVRAEIRRIGPVRVLPWLILKFLIVDC